MEFEEVKVNSERWLNLKDLLNEEWRDIKGYEALYKVSNYGRVKSLEISSKDTCMLLKTKIKKTVIRKNNFDKDGYCYISLWKNGKGKEKRVHRLVAEAFILNTNNKPVVNHINGIKNDNKINNLEWCTRSENDLHAYKTGLRTVNKTGTGKFGKLNGHSREIYMLDAKTDKIIKKFDALADAARYLGRKPSWMSHISEQIKGKKKTAYGYKWRYVDADS